MSSSSPPAAPRYHPAIDDDATDETWSSGLVEELCVEETEYGSDEEGGMHLGLVLERLDGATGSYCECEDELPTILLLGQLEPPQPPPPPPPQQACTGTRAESSSSRPASLNKPHKAQDAAWAAIRAVISSDGLIGLHHFRFLHRLGSGDIGRVYLTELQKMDGTGTGLYYAMKIVDKCALAKRNKLHRAQTEQEILEILDHPFLPTLYAHIDDGRRSCLVMEFCPGGDLHVLRQLQPGKRFAVKAVRFYAAEVLMALEYLHMMGVIYRDLKPENVLVCEDGHIMLSDFDLSLKCSVKPVMSTRSIGSEVRKDRWGPAAAGRSAGPSPCMATPLGCVVSPCSVHPITSCLPIRRSCLIPYFSGRHLHGATSPSVPPHHPHPHHHHHHHQGPGHPTKPGGGGGGGSRNNYSHNIPELLAEPTAVRSMSFVGTHEYLAPEIILGEGHGAAVDWWTLGIFLYELLHGRTPFKGPDNESTLTNVVTQLLKFPTTLGTAASADGSLAQHYNNPNVHTSYLEAQDLIKGLLVKDPRKRFGAVKGATEIKQHSFFRGVNWALIRSVTPPEIPVPFTLGANHNVSSMDVRSNGSSVSHLADNHNVTHRNVHHQGWVSDDDICSGGAASGGATPEFEFF